MPFLSSLWTGAFPRGVVGCENEPTKTGTMSGLMSSVGLGGFMGKITTNEKVTTESLAASTSSTPSVTPTSVTEPSSSPSSIESKTLLDSNPSDGFTPVQYEQYAREYMQIAGQDNFDGFRLEASKAVNSQLQTSHSLFLGTTMRETGYIYQFGPTFALEDGQMFIMGRYGNDGAMTARALKKFGTQSEARVSASSSLDTEQRNMLEVSLDHSGSDWAASLKTAWQGTWILNSTFSQVVTPRLQMGGDLTYITANSASIGSVGVRYRNGEGIFSAAITRQPNFKSPTGLTQNIHSCKFQYFKKISDRLSLGTELEVSHEKPGWESSLKFGYEYLFRQARIQGLLDTSGKVSVCAQDATGFGISGMIDYWKNDYRFGFMMQIVPPPEGQPQHST